MFMIICVLMINPGIGLAETEDPIRKTIESLKEMIIQFEQIIPVINKNIADLKKDEKNILSRIENEPDPEKVMALQTDLLKTQKLKNSFQQKLDHITRTLDESKAKLKKFEKRFEEQDSRRSPPSSKPDEKKKQRKQECSGDAAQ